MPEVTGFRRPRGAPEGSRVVVELDGDPWLTLEESAVLRLGLCVGLELDDQLRREAERAARLGAAERRAARLLASRPHARAELEQKLGRSSGPAVAKAVTARLADHGLIDDRAFAERLARRRLAQGYGPARVDADLARAGVAADLRREVLAGVERNELMAAARTAAAGLAGAAAWQRLSRRGFEEETIEDAVGPPHPDGFD